MADGFVKTEVHGVRELASGSRRLAGKIDDEAHRRLATVASREATVVSGKVPRVSGRLASSVTSEGSGDIALLTMGAGVPYAGWIEYGGSRGRSYVSQGRYVYPTALADAHLAELAGEQAASDAIGVLMAERLIEGPAAANGRVPAEVEILQDDIRSPSFTGRELALIRECTGKQFSQLLSEDGFSDDTLMALAFLKLRREGHRLEWDDMLDVVIRVRLGEATPVDPTNAASSATSPRSATTGT